MLMAMTLQAEVTVKEYREEMASSTVYREAMKAYITGLGDGIRWANATALSDNNKPLYCGPGNLAFGVENGTDTSFNDVLGKHGFFIADGNVNMLDPVGETRDSQRNERGAIAGCHWFWNDVGQWAHS